MTDAYAKYRKLKFQRAAERILEILLNNPGRLNATNATMHEELACVWRDIDADPDVSVAMIRGAGDAFSAGGDLELVEAIANDFETRTRVWLEAREMVYNIINCSTCA
jgi:enoyl-CoA hydratase/carnithine racemase